MSIYTCQACGELAGAFHKCLASEVPWRNSEGMTKQHCRGCEDDFYNQGGGGAKECWAFSSAKLIMRKKVSIDQVPPWTQAAETYPSCYHVKRFVFVKPNQER